MTLKWRHLMCWCDWMFRKNPVTLWLTLSIISATLHYRVHVFCATLFNFKVYYHPSISLIQLEFIFTPSRSIREILTLKTLGSEIKHRFFCAKSSLSRVSAELLYPPSCCLHNARVTSLNDFNCTKTIWLLRCYCTGFKIHLQICFQTSLCIAARDQIHFVLFAATTTNIIILKFKESLLWRTLKRQTGALIPREVTCDEL